MAKRSLCASTEGAKLARKIFDRRGWTQENLAAELDLRTRQPIWRFFTCRPIERYIFIELCTILDLNWWEIAEQVPEPLLHVEGKSSEHFVGTNQLVEQIQLKHQERIEHQCATLRVLGTSYPVQLEGLYVMPQLLSRLAGQEYANIAQLETHVGTLSNLRDCRLADSIMPLWQTLENQPKLRILGKPGSGKTTLLKWVALQCSRGKFQSSLIPVLIRLGSYMPAEKAEFSLLNCVQQELLGCGCDQQTLETLLKEGKFLLLIDELDEVAGQVSVNLIYREICRFLERYHKNKAIITSRLGGQDFELQPFADFELTDFNSEQISLLAEKWFSVFERSTPAESLATAEEFIHQLNAPENRRIKELAGIPLLFTRICQTFQGRGRLFEYRNGIYEECLMLWLSEWDRKRGVQCSNSNFQLSISEQIYILSRIATCTLEKGSYFFEQSELEHYIEASLREQQALDQSSVALRDEMIAQTKLTFLKQGILLEQARGIMSFANLAFQEYLVSRQLTSNPNLDRNLTKLWSHLTDPNWREVFLLVNSKLPDQNLMQQRFKLEMQAMVTQRPYIETFLSYLKQKSSQWLTYCQVAEVHALFYQLARTPDLLLSFAALLTSLSVLAQQLLMEVTVAKLALRLVALNGENAQAYTIVQSLINQTVILASNCQRHMLVNALLHLTEQLSQLQAAGLTKQWHSQISWLECLAPVMNECFSDNGSITFNIEHIQALQLYIYVVQMSEDCQNRISSNQAVTMCQAFSSAQFNQDTVSNSCDLFDVLITNHLELTQQSPKQKRQSTSNRLTAIL